MSINITGTFSLYKHCNILAIGVVKVKKPKHEKQATARKNVFTPKSNESCVTTIPKMPVLYITFPVPKKNIKNTQLTTAKIRGIDKNLR